MKPVYILVLTVLTVLCGAGAYVTAAAGAENPLVGNFSTTCLFLMGTGVTTIFVLLGK